MEQARFLVISGSLHPDSRSRCLAKAGLERLEQLCSAEVVDQRESSGVEWIDLAEYPLPFCDGHSAYGDPNVGTLTAKVKAARGILLASPVYNYDVNAVVKNMIELTGRSWQDKVVGLMCAAGGQGSYMALMSLANSLMLDFRCLVLPRFVYATGDAFSAQGIEDELIQGRVDELADRFYQVANAVPLPPPAV